MTDSSFVVITGSEAEDIKRLPARQLTRTTALRNGDVVWLPGRTASGATGSYQASFRKEGKRVVARSAVRDGVKGCYLWLEDLP